MKPTIVLLLFASLTPGAIVREPALKYRREVLPTHGGPVEQTPGKATASNFKKQKHNEAASSALLVGGPGMRASNSMVNEWASIAAAYGITEFNPFLVVPLSQVSKERVNGKEFCDTLRGLGWIAGRLMAYARTDPKSKYIPAGDYTDKTLGALWMMKVWEGHLNALQLRLKRTASLPSQMVSASCYVDYGKAAGTWLKAMLKTADKFEKRNPTRQTIREGLKQLAVAHLGVARWVHEAKTGTLIADRIPKVDVTGEAAMLKNKYGMEAGQSLRKWVKDNDPICPKPKGGLFRTVILAWRYERGNATNSVDGETLKDLWLWDSPDLEPKPVEPRPKIDDDDDDDDDEDDDDDDEEEEEDDDDDDKPVRPVKGKGQRVVDVGSHPTNVTLSKRAEQEKNEASWNSTYSVPTREGKKKDDVSAIEDKLTHKDDDSSSTEESKRKTTKQEDREDDEAEENGGGRGDDSKREDDSDDESALSNSTRTDEKAESKKAKGTVSLNNLGIIKVIYKVLYPGLRFSEKDSLYTALAPSTIQKDGHGMGSGEGGDARGFQGST